MIFKEAIDLKKIVANLEKQSMFYMNEVWDLRIEIPPIEKSLDEFMDYIELKIRELKLSVFEFKTRDSEDGIYDQWLIEVINTENGFLYKGRKIVNELIIELENKSLTDDTMDLMEKMIAYQFEIAKKILDRKWTLDNIQEMISYFKEVPLYLKFDLSLGNKQIVSEKVDMEIDVHEIDSGILKSYYKAEKYYYNIA